MHQHALSICKIALLTLLAAGLGACNNGDSGLLGGPATPENTAPQALNVAVWGQITAPEAARSNVKTTLQLTGEYFDAESDVADTHEFRWKKNGVVIEGANSSKLVLVGDTELVDAEFIGCVTPIAKTGVRRGLEVCAPASNGGSPAVPPGTPVPAAQPTITGTPAVGLVIKSRYNYAPNGTVAGSAEGDSKFGWLIYRDPSLPTLVSCEANAGVDCDYTVDAADKDKTIYSCVQPRNQLGVWGAVRCDNTNANNNVAPELLDTVIWGVAQDGVTLTVNARYFDQDGDHADSDAIVKSVRWLRRDTAGNETQVATGNTTYKVTGAVEGVVFKACATPFSMVPGDKPYVVRQGIEVCTTTSVDGNTVLPPNSPTPLAIPTISGTPLQGRTIAAVYSYDANVQPDQDGANSGEDPAKSQFAWLVENASGLFELQKPVCTAGAGSTCDLTVTNAMVGKKLKACVLPANQLGAYGPIACTDVNGDTRGIGVTLSGELEYGKTLTAHVVGLDDGSYQYQWKMNLATHDGPTNDTLASRAEVVSADGGAGNSNTFTIGTLHISDADSNGDGVVTDSEWVAKYPDSDWMKLQPTYTPGGSAGPKDANFFVGKDVTLCVQSSTYNEDICVNASEQQDPDSEGVICNDSNRCVTSGIYYDEAASSPLVKRGVAPVAELSIASGAVFYRAMSYAESQLNIALNLGEDAKNSIADIYNQNTFNGIEQALNAIYFDGIEMDIKVCRERGLAVPVHGFELPAVSENGYGPDKGAKYVLRNDMANNPSPPGSNWLNYSLGALFRERLAYDETFALIDAADPYDSYNYELVSPTTGWSARQWGYASSTRGTTDYGLAAFYHAIRRYLGVITPSDLEGFRGRYDVMSSTNNPVRYIAISCVVYP